MKKLIGLILFCMPCWAVASGDVKLDDVDIDLSDKASLVRGAKLYVTNCQSCHSLKHMRYSRIGQDLEMSDDQVRSELVTGSRTIFDSMTTAMVAEEAEKWFLGIAPPDLSVIARVRGPDWLYSYLRGFYLDDSRPFGVNNSVYKDVAMPNVLWQLQGYQKAVFQKQAGQETVERLTLVEGGALTPEEFDRAMTDLVNFLVYAAEPSQLERVPMGKYVLLFLSIFLVLAYLLKKEYWKDVH